MSTEEVFKILDEAVDMGVMWVSLSGGETFLRTDLRSIINKIKRSGLTLLISTNGSLIDESWADFLAEFSLLSVEISVYGVTPGTYESVTQTPGSFDKCMRALDLFAERRISFFARTPMMTLNQHEITDIQALVQDKGGEFGAEADLWSCVNGDLGPCALRPSAEDAIRLEYITNDYVRTTEFNRQDTLYSCNAGRTSFRVDPYGFAMMCTFQRTPRYGVCKHGVKYAWDRLVMFRNQDVPWHYKCKDCQYGNFCDMCAAYSQIEHNDPYAPIGYLCDLARVRARYHELISQGLDPLSQPVE